MSKYTEEELHQLLGDTARLLDGFHPPEKDEYSLESILAEFGQGAAKPAPVSEPVKAEEPPVSESAEPAAEKKAAEEPEEVSLEDTIAEVVDETLHHEKSDEPENARMEADAPATADVPEGAGEVTRKLGEVIAMAMRRAEANRPETKDPQQGECPEKIINIEGRRNPPQEAEPSPETEEEPASEESAEELPTEVTEDEQETVTEDETAPEENDAEEGEPELIEIPVRSPVALDQLMRQTVESVLEEDDELLEEPEPFLERVERMLLGAAQGAAALLRCKKKKTMPWEDDEIPMEEPDMEQAEKESRRRCKKLRKALLLLTVPAAALIALAALEMLGYLPAIWQTASVRFGTTGGVLLLAMAAAAPVWKEIRRELKKHRLGCEAAACFSAVVALADCVHGAVTGGGQLPFAAPAAMMLWACLWGMLKQAESRRGTFHLVDLGGRPPYSASVTSVGACKQKGKLRGFYYLSYQEDLSRSVQTYAVPLLQAAATVLAGVVCLGENRTDRALWIWSAILTAGLPLSLPLAGVLPVCWLNRRLVRSGSAVAGYCGAELVSEAKRMVLTDDDLFPPGTVSMNGLKIYGEEIGKVVSYAATMAKASGSQLSPLFEQLLASEGGVHMELEDLHYYEEGGVGGTIRGESVTMGTAYFMKKQKVNLPRDLKLKTGVFLAVDSQLVAIFAVEYQPSRNVEWALRALRRNHIQMVLGVRSENITPGLLKRKFHIKTKAVYPDISARLALSDLTGEEAAGSGAVIYREGLMPFAETVIGSRRLVSAVRIATVFCYIGAVAGLFLSYYLAHTGDYAVLCPIRMLAFLLLWTVPTLLLSGTVKHF